MATLTRRLRRLILSSLLVAVAGLGGCYATPELSTVQWASICVMMLGITVALGSLIALPAARAWQTGGNPRLSALALAISVLATAIVAGLQVAHTLGWSDHPTWESVRRFAFPVFMAAVLASMLAVVSERNVNPRVRWLQVFSLGAGSAFVALLFLMVALDTGNRTLFKILGMLLATDLTAAGSIAVIKWRARRGCQ